MDNNVQEMTNEQIMSTNEINEKLSEKLVSDDENSVNTLDNNRKSQSYNDEDEESNYSKFSESIVDYSDNTFSDNNSVETKKEYPKHNYKNCNNDIFLPTKKDNSYEDKGAFAQTPNSSTTNTISIPEYSNLIDNRKQYYSYKDLSSKNNLIEIFYAFDLIIFTDDYKLRHKKCYDYFNFFKRSYVSSDDFPGIGFLSIDAITLIKKEISTHNKYIQDSENIQNYLNYQICFDEGDFHKNMVYKKKD